VVAYAIQIQGQSVGDANVKRSLRSVVRVRNERLAGACPV